MAPIVPMPESLHSAVAAGRSFLKGVTKKG